MSVSQETVAGIEPKVLKALEKAHKKANGGHFNPLLVIYNTVGSASKTLDVVYLFCYYHYVYLLPDIQALFPNERLLDENDPTDVLEFIDAIVANGEDINVTNTNQTDGILHLFHYPEVIKKIVELGGDIDLSPPAIPSRTPLSSFIDSITFQRFCFDFDKVYNILKTYLELGADHNKTNLIAQLAQNINASASNIYNVPQNAIKILELAFSYGANPNLNTYTRPIPRNPLCTVNAPQIIKLLLQHGADPNIQYDGEDEPPLYRAIGTRDPERVKVFLENGADPNLKIKRWRDSPLVFALTETCYSTENIESVEKICDLLMDYGTNFNATDELGNTVLTTPFGTYSGKYLPVTLLVEHGADPLSVNYSGNTALHSLVLHCPRDPALKDFYIDDVHTLINAGVDINAKNNHGETPFVVACKYYRENYRKYNFPKETVISLLSALVQQGADINVIDPQKDRPVIDILPKYLQKHLKELYEHCVEYTTMCDRTGDYDTEIFER